MSFDLPFGRLFGVRQFCYYPYLSFGIFKLFFTYTSNLPPTVNFLPDCMTKKNPHFDSNIPTTPAYGVSFSQLIRYVRVCNLYSGILSTKLFNKVFQIIVSSYLSKIFRRYQHLVEQYSVNCAQMKKDGIDN